MLGTALCPAEAAETLAFVTGELAELAAALRRLERLSPAERRVARRSWPRLGMSREEVGRRLGVSAGRCEVPAGAGPGDGRAVSLAVTALCGR